MGELWDASYETGSSIENIENNEFMNKKIMF